MLTLDAVRATPNVLAGRYQRFRVAERLLLTGHSHQAWPDRGFEGQSQAWLDAATLVDEKWDKAFAVAERVRRGWAQWLDDREGDIALGTNTHDLLVKFLSALPLGTRPRLVTTDGEFHSIRRQLDRLAEEGIDVVKVDAHPVSTLVERMASTVNDRTAAVLVSAVLFRNAHIVPGLGELVPTCRRVGAELVVDAYHAVNVVPFSIRAQGLESAYVVGGGYKYCQLGEGNGFLRLPPDCALRPVVTGWFSEFGALTDAHSGDRVRYGAGAARFGGATYDPVSHYRAAAVFDFFADLEVTPEFLRIVSQHQVGTLAAAFDAIDADPAVIDRDRSVALADIGGFLALRAPAAGALSAALRERGVMTDFRGDILRLGPAPYLSDHQLHMAMETLADALASLRAA